MRNHAAPLVVLLIKCSWLLQASALRSVPIARERAETLSVAAFRERYATPGVPVVLEGAASAWPAMKWSPKTLGAACGHAEFRPKRVQQGSCYLFLASNSNSS